MLSRSHRSRSLQHRRSEVCLLFIYTVFILSVDLFNSLPVCLSTDKHWTSLLDKSQEESRGTVIAVVSSVVIGIAVAAAVIGVLLYCCRNTKRLPGPNQRLPGPNQRLPAAGLICAHASALTRLQCEASWQLLFLLLLIRDTYAVWPRLWEYMLRRWVSLISCFHSVTVTPPPPHQLCSTHHWRPFIRSHRSFKHTSQQYLPAMRQWNPDHV